MKINEFSGIPSLLSIGQQLEEIQKTNQPTWQIAMFLNKGTLPFKEETKTNIFSI